MLKYKIKVSKREMNKCPIKCSIIANPYTLPLKNITFLCGVKKKSKDRERKKKRG